MATVRYSRSAGLQAEAVLLGINSLSKMFTAVLLMTGIYTTAAFNINKDPVTHFRNEDRLFGQIIVQSKDGVLVPSPNSGVLFKCDLVNKCNKVNDAVAKQNGLTPVTSVASSQNHDKLLVCNQLQKNDSSNGFNYLNGYCTLLLNQEGEQISPASLVKEYQTTSDNKMKNDVQCQESKNNTNNNNNYYHGNPTGYHQALRRVRRESENNNKDTSENDEEDGTEIAFVLDGSGSIEFEDFERAKDFIYNVMKEVWISCFSCNFAIVQYGTVIRTELSLLENKNVNEALTKVKGIKQVYNYTKTASALHHVLTEVFVPEHGSRKDSKKIIILLSDGEMRADDRTLPDVLNMPQMKNVTRFAIGVGPEVVNKEKAEKQMLEIASDKAKYFNVSNYAALKNILSILEEKIIAIEGIQKGAGFLLELSEAGFSTHFAHDGSLLFGSVGAYDWSGGIILKKDKTVTFLNSSKEEPRFSYLGYSVASTHAASKTLYVSGAPRYNLTGAVFVFDGTCEKVLTGDQVGSYFGAVLCVLDIDQNGETDYLLVGAPHFHNRAEEGKVVMYKLNQGTFERVGELKGMGQYEYARFGSAIASIGDVDGNKYIDVAVGAPLEADDLSGSSGSIYIFNGFKDGLKQHHSQRISPSDFGMKLVYFGQAVSAMTFTEMKHFFSVGSEGHVTVLESLPVIVINAVIKAKVEIIPLVQQTSDISKKYYEPNNLNICFNAIRNRIVDYEELLIEYELDLDSGKKTKRLSCDNCIKRTSFTMTKDISCTDPITLNFMGCHDCFSPIRIKLNFTLIVPSSGRIVRVLDIFTKTEVTKEIQFEKDCNVKDHCQSNISLIDSKISTDTVIIGHTQALGITFNLSNAGDTSYMTTLTLTYPEILQAQKHEGAHCEVKDFQIMCKLLHPTFKRDKKMTVGVTWQPLNRKSDLRNATITAVLTGGNNGSEKLDSKTYSFGVKNALAVQLNGKAAPQRLGFIEGETTKQNDDLQFTFELSGKNEYQAKINVIITIQKYTQKTDLMISSVEPKSCTMPESDNSKSTFHIECTLTDAQVITIKTNTKIHDIQSNNEKIIATAELSFDESIFEGTDIRMKEQVEVMLSKTTVLKSTNLIIGGSIAGFLVLIILIIILIKCGFFRRRHKLERGESLH